MPAAILVLMRQRDVRWTLGRSCGQQHKQALAVRNGAGWIASCSGSPIPGFDIGRGFGVWEDGVYVGSVNLSK